MADEPAAAAPAVEPAPAASVAAPSGASTPAPEQGGAAAVEQPKPAEGAAPVEAPKPEAAADPAHDDTPSLVEQAGKKPDEPKPGEKPKEGEPPKPAEAAAPAYEFKPYTLPEGFKADEARIGELNTLLTQADLSPQDRGQRLVDMHIAEVNRVAQEIAREQWSVFNKTRADWRKEVMADERLGGSRFDTTMANIARARDQFVPEAEKAGFIRFLRTTGAGDNIHWIRMMDAMGAFLAEPAPRRPDFKPPPDIGKAPKSAGGRREGLYDHPNSVARREQRG